MSYVHAIQICRKYDLKFEIYITNYFTIKTYRRIYEIFMHSIRIEDLKYVDSCYAFSMKKMIDRFKKKRLRIKIVKKIRLSCYSLCEHADHNSRRCDEIISNEVDDFDDI